MDFGKNVQSALGRRLHTKSGSRFCPVPKMHLIKRASSGEAFFLFHSISSLNKGITLWSKVKSARAVPWPWLTRYDKLLLLQTSRLPGQFHLAGSIFHVHGEEWLSHQDILCRWCFPPLGWSSVKSGWQQINGKLGRNKNDGKNVCELVLVCVRSSKTGHQWALQAFHPSQASVSSTVRGKIAEKIKWANECASTLKTMRT